jgi:hypothetical protein
MEIKSLSGRRLLDHWPGDLEFKYNTDRTHDIISRISGTELELTKLIGSEVNRIG